MDKPLEGAADPTALLTTQAPQGNLPRPRQWTGSLLAQMRASRNGCRSQRNTAHAPLIQRKARARDWSYPPRP